MNTKKDLINTNIPREVFVYDNNDGTVDVIPTYTDPIKISELLEREKIAKQVSDKLIKLQNPTYYIPKLLKITEDDKKYVARYEKIKGEPLTPNFFESLNEEDKNIIYKGIVNFLNDINQSHPILNIKEYEENSKTTFNKTINSIISILPDLSDKLKKIQDIKNWFYDIAEKQGNSYVFFQGDIHVNSLFYNPETKILSIIDFRDCKYVQIETQFEWFRQTLSWPDRNRLKKEYLSLPRKHNIKINEDEYISKFRILFKNFENATESVLDDKKSLAVHNAFIKILNDYIKDLIEYNNKIKNDTFAKSAEIINAYNSVNGQRGRGAIGLETMRPSK